MTIETILKANNRILQAQVDTQARSIEAYQEIEEEALERIKELESQIAGQWISVETELPSSECLCVVYNAKSGGVMTSHFNGKDFSVVMIDWVKAENYCPVTHYIVLPTPPKDSHHE